VGSMTRGLRRVDTWRGEQPVIERASSADLTFLAMEAGKIPQQFAAILLLEPSGDFKSIPAWNLPACRFLGLGRRCRFLLATLC
jgi:hypothetical protein